MAYMEKYFLRQRISEAISILKAENKKVATTEEIFNLYISDGKSDNFFREKFEEYLLINSKKLGINRKRILQDYNSQWIILE